MLYVVYHNPQQSTNHPRELMFTYSRQLQRFVNIDSGTADAEPLCEIAASKLANAARNAAKIMPAINSGGPIMLIFKFYGNMLATPELLGYTNDYQLIQHQNDYAIIPAPNARIHLHTHTALMQAIANTVRFTAAASYLYAGCSFNVPVVILFALSAAMLFSDHLIEHMFGKPVALGSQIPGNVNTDLRNALLKLHATPEFSTLGSVIIMLLGAAMVNSGNISVALLGAILLAAPLTYCVAATFDNQYAITHATDERAPIVARDRGEDPVALEAAGVDVGNMNHVPMAQMATPSPLRNRTHPVVTARRGNTPPDEVVPVAQEAGNGQANMGTTRRRLFTTLGDEQSQTLQRALENLAQAQEEARDLGMNLRWN